MWESLVLRRDYLLHDVRHNFVSIQQNCSGATTMINMFNPFGGGPRRCPGAELARVELSVFLHRLVTQFRYHQVRVAWSLIFMYILILRWKSYHYFEFNVKWDWIIWWFCSWEAIEQDKLVFFPTTRTQKRYPITIQRLKQGVVE